MPFLRAALARPAEFLSSPSWGRALIGVRDCQGVSGLVVKMPRRKNLPLVAF